MYVPMFKVVQSGEEGDRGTVGVVADIGTDFTPIIGELKIKRLGRGLSWLKGKKAELAARSAKKLKNRHDSRKAKRLEKAAEKARQTGGGGRGGPPAERGQAPIERDQSDLGRGEAIGAAWNGLDELGNLHLRTGGGRRTRQAHYLTREQTLALGVNRDVAQALYHWYKNSASGAWTHERTELSCWRR
jgi:hypothetical protein